MKKHLILLTIIILTLIQIPQTQAQIEKETNKNIIMTGHFFYETQKQTIIPLYYSTITLLLLLLFISLTFEKNEKKELIKEAEILLNKEKTQKIKKLFEESQEKNTIKTNLDKQTKYQQPKKEIQKEIQKEETKIDENELYKNSEEKLEKEIQNEIKEENKKTKEKKLKGQPSPKGEGKETPKEI